MALLGVLGLLAAFSCFAQTKKPEDTASSLSAGLERMPESLEARFALSAAPPHLRDAATVYLLDPAKLTRSARTLKLTLGVLIGFLVLAIGIGSSLIVADLNRQLTLARQKTENVNMRHPPANGFVARDLEFLRRPQEIREWPRKRRNRVRRPNDCDDRHRRALQHSFDLPDDGPSLVLMSRAVNALVSGQDAQHPVWDLPGK